MSGAVRASVGTGRFLSILLLLACAPGPDVSSRAGSGRSFPPSGFLGDYTQLRPGKGGQARLAYLDTAHDFSGYTQVIIEPVEAWKSDPVRFAGVSQAQRETLARAWENELRRAFSDEFQVVDGKARSGALRLRSALTAAIGAAENSDASGLQYLEVEAELLDAGTNQRLAAAVDSKGSAEGSRAGPQVDAGAAFRDWAERASIRFSALRNFDRKFRESEGP